MRLSAVVLIALAVAAGPAAAGARDGGHGDFGNRGSHDGRHGFHDGRHDFHHHHHFFLRDFVVIGAFGWPYAYYPYWVDEPAGYFYGPPPSQVQLGDPIPGQENCREFRTTIVVDNEAQPAYGKACQQPNGSWLIAP